MSQKIMLPCTTITFRYAHYTQQELALEHVLHLQEVGIEQTRPIFLTLIVH